MVWSVDAVRIVQAITAKLGHVGMWSVDPTPRVVRWPVLDTLRLDFTLTDDVYASPSPVEWRKGQYIYVPEIAVGRLVERPAQMAQNISAYLGAGGESPITSTLAAGYDFMVDAVESADEILASAGIGDSSRTTLVGTGWGLADIRRELSGSRRGLMLLGVHANHFYYELPDSTFLRSDAVGSVVGEQHAATVFTMACHGGLNAPGDEHVRAVDFPEAWLERGANLVGSTGWAYGMEGAVAYQEALMVGFVEHLSGPMGGSVGEALLEAKRAYWYGNEPSAFHAKTLAGTVLYGVPMLRQSPISEHGGLDHSSEAIASTSKLSAPRPDELIHVRSEEALDDLWLKPGSRYPMELDDLMLVESPDGSYYTYSGRRPRAEAGQPFQPLFEMEMGSVNRDGQILDARGVVLVSTTHRDIGEFTPLVRRAGVLGRPAAALAQGAARFDAAGWYPRVPMTLRTAHDHSPGGGIRSRDGSSRLILTVGQYDAETGRERLLEEITLDEYYSASEDRTGPAIGDVRLISDESTTRLDVHAIDSSAIIRGVVAFSAEGGRWESREMKSAAEEYWTASVPPGSVWIAQLVDGAGNVTIVDDLGDVKRPCAGLCKDRPTGATSRSYLPLLRR